MSDCILVINAGSSSVKFALYGVYSEKLSATLKGQISGIGHKPAITVIDNKGHSLDFPLPAGGVGGHEDAFEALIDWLEARGDRVIGAGHRIVHGGADFTAPVRLDGAVLDALSGLINLAPHHQPHNLAAVRALSTRLANVAQVACFDTAFHADQPAEARELGLPRSYNERGIRRYGFHGLSYEAVVDGLPDLTGKPLPARLVVAHLGNGASLCAVANGKSIATTMGFSTLDGIAMATRSGAVDPGVLLHLMREDGAGLNELEDLLYNQSGLLGVSGISQDMRALLDSQDPAAKFAIDYFCYRVSRELGSLVAALGGLDGLVFTGGIGENASPVRDQILRRSAWLGFELDNDANHTGDWCITTPESVMPAWVMLANEELVIARHTRQILGL